MSVIIPILFALLSVIRGVLGSEHNLVELIQRLKDELKAQSLSNGQMDWDGSEQSAVMTDLDFHFVLKRLCGVTEL